MPTLGSAVAVYDTHRRYDIELNSLITSGDWNEHKHIVSYKTADVLIEPAMSFTHFKKLQNVFVYVYVLYVVLFKKITK